MTGEGQHHCRSCRATLRRGHTGALCDPCTRAARSYGRCPVPGGFYDTPAVRVALANYDFGPVFRAVRSAGALSQEEFGFLVGLSQARVSDVERGAHRLRDVTVIARVAGALGIPARLLGFDSPSAGNGNGDKEEVSWVDRRDFLGLVTAATLGSGLHAELDRLAALLPTHTDPVTRPHIGDTDIDAIETITDGLRRSEHSHGGGLCRAAALAQLHQVRRLEDATCPQDVRTRLLLATADLAGVAAWICYDSEAHDSARRLWTFALDTTRRVEDHPQSTDLAVSVLGNMATQALHLDRPHEALRLVQLQSVTAENRTHPASPIMRSAVLTSLGYCRAALGEAEPCRRAMGQEVEEWANALDTTPPWHWTQHASTALIAGFTAEKQGNALELLSRTRPEFAPAAIEQLRIAVDSYDDTWARARAIELAFLANAYFRAGNVDSAVATGHQTVTVISGLSSKLAYAKLHIVDTAAEPFGHKPDVAELRERIRDALATVA